MSASLLRLSVIGAVLLVLAIAPGSANAGSLLVNGGFEDGVMGWDWDPEALEIASVAHPVAGGEGDHAGRLTTSDGTGTARAVQEVPLPGGGTYRLTGKVFFSDPNVRSFRLEIAWFGVAGGPSGDVRASPALSSTGGLYQPLATPSVSIPCDAQHPRAVIRLDPQNGKATAFVDALRLERIATAPCPTATPTAARGPTAEPTAVSPAPDPIGGPEPDRPDGSIREPEEAASAADAGGALLNGGFEAAEDGQPAAWRTFGGVLAQVTRPVRSGTFAGGFASATESTKWVYQPVSAEPLAWYDMTAYVYADGPRVEAAFLRISWYTSPDATGRAVASIDSTSTLETAAPRYRRLTTGPVQAPPGVHSARVRILLRPRSAASAVIFIDDVTFRRTAARPTVEGESGSVPGATGSSARRATGAGRSSEVRGLTSPDTLPIAPFPTPVIRRALRPEGESPVDDGGNARWWPWALAATTVVALAGAGGWTAWTRRRSRDPAS